MSEYASIPELILILIFIIAAIALSMYIRNSYKQQIVEVEKDAELVAKSAKIDELKLKLAEQKHADEELSPEAYKEVDEQLRIFYQLEKNQHQHTLNTQSDGVKRKKDH